MALPDLAAAADLAARGVEDTQYETVDVMLTVASAVVRAAAQSPILETESTVQMWVTEAGGYVDLPGQPVTAVSEVVFDGDTLAETDYALVYGRLWLGSAGGFRRLSEPVGLEVTLTHGFAEVPADIVQLVCDLAIAGIGSATEGAHDPRVVAEKIDDYSVTFAQGAAAVATAMELPASTKQALRKRFGGGVALVGAA